VKKAYAMKRPKEEELLFGHVKLTVKTVQYFLVCRPACEEHKQTNIWPRTFHTYPAWVNTGVGSVSGRKPDEAETVVTWSHFTRPSLSLGQAFPFQCYTHRYRLCFCYTHSLYAELQLPFLWLQTKRLLKYEMILTRELLEHD
jgi:hypothetical protein